MSESMALWWLATMTALGVLVWSRFSQPSMSTWKKGVIMFWTMNASTLRGGWVCARAGGRCARARAGRGWQRG